MQSKDSDLMPKRQTIGSCGYDFCLPEDVTFEPGKWTDIDTGVSFNDGMQTCSSEIKNPIPTYLCPTRWFMLVVPRSSLGMKYGFRFANSVGIIDCDYRDTIKARITVDKELAMKKGERFMQGILIPYLVDYKEEQPTKTRNGGIGSTGHD